MKELKNLKKTAEYLQHDKAGNVDVQATIKKIKADLPEVEASLEALAARTQADNETIQTTALEVLDAFPKVKFKSPVLVSKILEFMKTTPGAYPDMKERVETFLKNSEDFVKVKGPNGGIYHVDRPWDEETSDKAAE